MANAPSSPDLSPPDAPPPAPGRTGLLVLGMHRAGTSLLARVLHLLGAAMPRTLIGGSPNNEAGYWESRPVRDLDDRLLRAAGTSWDGWTPIAPAWFDTLDAAGFGEEARDLLLAEWGGAPLIALKDPRACRLAPFWLRAFEGAGLSPLAVLTLRDPVEVAASLEARNGLAPEQGHLLWLRHALDAEAATRGHPRAFSTYEGLLADWRAEARRIGERLRLDWPVPPEAVPESEAPVREDLRHQRAEPRDGAPLPPPAVREAQAILDRFAVAGEDAGGRARLDALRAELDAAARLAGPALGRATDLRAAELGRENADLKDRIARSEARGQLQRGLADERLRALEEARRDLKALQERLGRAEARAEAKAEVAAELRGVLEAAMADARSASRRGDAFAARLREREADLATRNAELARLTELLLEAEGRGLRPRERLRTLREAATATARPVASRVASRLGIAAGRGDGSGLSGRELRRRMEEVRRSGAFDAEWYLRANLDVALAGLDPLRHYVTHGEREGRPPSGRGNVTAAGSAAGVPDPEAPAEAQAKAHAGADLGTARPGPAE